MKLKSLMIATCLVAAANAFAFDAESEVRAIYKGIEVCIKKSDCESVIKLLAPNYQYTDQNGKTMSRAESVKYMKEMSKTSRNSRGTMTVDEVHVYGNEASAWVSMSMDMEVKDGSKWVSMHFDMKYVETLSKATGKWMFLETFELPGKN